MGNSHKNHLVWNQQLNQNQTLMEQSLDCPFIKLCPAVTLSHQDGHHSAVALLLKAAFIQVHDYRLLGVSGFVIDILFYFFCSSEECKSPCLTDIHGRRYKFSVSVIDLDYKPFGKVQKWQELELEMLKAYKEMESTQPCASHC